MTPKPNKPVITVECKECGKQLNGKRGFPQHLKKHDIGYMDYIVKHEHSGEIPTCQHNDCSVKLKFKGGGVFLRYCSPRCSRLGKSASKETKERMSKTHSERCKSLEVIEHIRKISRIKPSDTSAYSRANSRRWKDPEFAKKMIPHMRHISANQVFSKETRAKLSAAQKKRWSDPEARLEYSKRFSGSGNPNWNPDRDNQSERELFILECRTSFKKAKKYICSNYLDVMVEELGYTPRELKSHIGKQFEEGMSWENWGDWHIDHIYPVSMFPVSTDISVVNDLTNLRPLWASENLSKGNRTNVKYW